MQRYLQPQYLKDHGHEHFDSWIADYAEITTDIELTPTGTGFREKQRCRAYKNLPELQRDFRNCSDVQTAEMLTLPTPKLKGGKPTNIILQPSKAQEMFIEECGKRADSVHNRQVDSKVDNMLLITNDGKYAALDMRLIDPNLPDDPNSKINTCVKLVTEKYKEHSDEKGTQVIFLDIGTPSSSSSTKSSRYSGLCLYDDIKKKLIANGIPEKEIAFIHDAKTEEQKLKLFANMNSGDLRVLIGSTPKMGTGCNFQQRLCALHHLDVPWKPSDIEQREGRILRQGNSFAEVEIFRYATEKTFDAYSWQTIENKQKAIAQVMTDKPMGRSIDDLDSSSLNYAEIKSLATGDSRIKEQLELSTEVRKLKTKKAQFLKERTETNRRLISEYPKQLLNEKYKLKNYSADLETAEANPPFAEGEFKMQLKNETFTDRKEAAKQIFKLAKAATEENSSSETVIGEYRGFELTAYKKVKFLTDLYTMTEGTHLGVKGAAKYELSLGVGYEKLIFSIDNLITNEIPNLVREKQSSVEQLENNIEEARAKVSMEFAEEEDLKIKTEKLKQLTLELKLEDNSDNSRAAAASNSSEDDENNKRNNGGRH